jgi:RNA polymerase sigma-70 factor, ECF subfamily
MTEKDQIYIQGLIEGNREVFEKLFREYYPLMCNHARKYIIDKSTAEDLVQDLFCRIWDKRLELKINTSMANYLYRSVTNLCYNHYRDSETERKTISFHGDDMEEMMISGKTLPENAELSEHFGKALLGLPEKRRQIFELSRFDGMKYHEIAEQLDISIKTVETQMTRSLEFMRKQLKDFI